MTLVKKGSRLITVDGAIYRWRIRKRPASQGPLAFAVERADRRGAILLATMPSTRPSEWVGTSAPPVVPSIVAAMIRRARAEGWRPDHPGPAFPLTVDADIMAN